MFDHALTICAVCLGFVLLRVLRPTSGIGRGYGLFVASLLGLTVVAAMEGSGFLGAIALGLSVLGVGVPWVLELAVRVAFGRGFTRAAVTLLGVRAMLMPGAGLGRQQQVLRGLVVLETQGVEEALAYFRDLAQQAEGGELILIHEQIVAMLFYGHRWDEGISHYETRFHPSYAALRPALALGLLRAYGESGRFSTAASLLRAVEEGPVGRDVRALEFVSRARLMFLAYVGAAEPVAAALTETRSKLLGLSPAHCALLRGISLARAGRQEQARAMLERVAQVAGVADERAVVASQQNLATVGGESVEVPRGLAPYVDEVAERLDASLAVVPRAAESRRALLAPTLAVVVVALEMVRQALDHGGLGLLELGALTPELWRAGAHGRALVGLWVAGQPVDTLICAYALFMAGRFIERVLGPGRLWLVVLGGGGLGSIVSVVTLSPPPVVGGALLVAVAVTAGALTLLTGARGVGMDPMARRAWWLLLALLLAGLAWASLSGAFVLGLGSLGLIVAAVWGAVVAGFVPPTGVAARATGLLGWSLVVPLVLGLVQVAREAPEAALWAQGRDVQVYPGVRAELPPTFVASGSVGEVAGALPMPEGWVDRLALRTGASVRLILGPGELGDKPLVLHREPRLARRVHAVVAPVPEGFASCGDGGAMSAYVLVQDGEPVAITVERGGLDDRVVALVASPPVALEQGGQLYAELLCSARLVP